MSKIQEYMKYKGGTVGLQQYGGDLWIMYVLGDDSEQFQVAGGVAMPMWQFENIAKSIVELLHNKITNRRATHRKTSQELDRELEMLAKQKEFMDNVRELLKVVEKLRKQSTEKDAEIQRLTRMKTPAVIYKSEPCARCLNQKIDYNKQRFMSTAFPPKNARDIAVTKSEIQYHGSRFQDGEW